MENYKKGLQFIDCKETYDAFAQSGFFTLVRQEGDGDTREEV